MLSKANYKDMAWVSEAECEAMAWSLAKPFLRQLKLRRKAARKLARRSNAPEEPDEDEESLIESSAPC